MATARDLIKRSLRLLHVLETGEDPTTEEAADAFEALNSMLEEWNIDRAYVYYVQENAYTWPGSTQSRTIGATGDFVADRPNKIENSTFYTDSNSNDYNLRHLDTRRGYTSISDKDTSSALPEFIYYEPSYPNGEIFLWPTPSESVTLYLHTWGPLSQFASLDTTVDLAPGYKNLLVYGLCDYLAPEFGVAVPPEVQKISAAVKGRIKKKNFPVKIAQIEPAAFSEKRSFNVFIGY